MNKRNLLFGVSVIGLALAISATSFTLAYQGDPDKNGPGPRFSPENHEQVQQALESGDYQAWAEIMADRGKVTEVVTEENFEQFAQMHQLLQDGNFEEAKQIAEELGLPGMGMGPRRHGEGMEFHKGPRGPLVDTNGDGVCDWAEQNTQDTETE